MHRQLSDVGRTEGAGDEDTADHARACVDRARCRSATKAADIVGALGKKWIGQVRQLPCALLGCFAERICGRPAAFHHQLLNSDGESGVAGHQNARLYDVGFAIPARVAKPRRYVLELYRHGFQGMPRALQLARAISDWNRGRVASAHPIQDHGRTNRDTRGGADPAQRTFAHQG
jgi:hypothetical protein